MKYNNSPLEKLKKKILPWIELYLPPPFPGNKIKSSSFCYPWLQQNAKIMELQHSWPAGMCLTLQALFALNTHSSALLDFSIPNLHLYVSCETILISHPQTRRPGALFWLLYSNTSTQHTGTFITIVSFRTCHNKPGIILSISGKSIKKYCEKMETYSYMMLQAATLTWMQVNYHFCFVSIILLDRPISYFSVLWVEILVSSGYILGFSAILELQNSRSFSALTFISQLLPRIPQNRDLCFLPWWYSKFTKNYIQEKMTI